MEWRRKKETHRFLSARNGDMISSPFQCDCCWFVNLTKKLPNEHLLSDARLLAYIRRVNLDVFWMREPSTVASTFNALRKGMKMSTQLGLNPVHIAMGPWPMSDTCGFQVAIELLRASQYPGKNDSTYTQFDSIRKIRSAYINASESGPVRGLDNSCFKTDKGQMFSYLNGATQSKLFVSFMKGCEKRMGRLVKQNLGLSIHLLLDILRVYDDELKDENIPYQRKRMMIICAASFVILWAGALRGGEIFMLERSEFVKRRDDGRNSGTHGHVVIPLMGRFKGETGERNLVIILANITNSGLQVRKWVDYFSALLLVEEKHKSVGPALCDIKGDMLTMNDLNAEFHDILERLQREGGSGIPEDLIVNERFNVYRSFRRGATTRAKEMKVDPDVIEMNNRWRKVENKQGSLPKLPMSQLYMEITQVLDSKLQFSRSL